MFDLLREGGFDLLFLSHAEAILSADFPEAARELEHALTEATIPIEEIIAGGGGEAKGTQRLRRSLAAREWNKTTFLVEKIVNGVRREAQSHEVDHVRSYDGDRRVALEIEWNNKDPFYDRDLENFKRLHADGAISMGIIVTRGSELQRSMVQLVRRFVEERNINTLEDMREWGYEPTRKQRQHITRRVERTKNPIPFREALVAKFVADKFGEATTHWAKLQDRVKRGVGNPCPLVLIGLPPSVITFYEGKSALAEIERSDTEADEIP